MNERMCIHLSEMMNKLQLSQISKFQIVGHASEDLLQQMVWFDNLRYLELKNCQFIEGNCLLDMKINQLSHLNLMGSY